MVDVDKCRFIWFIKRRDDIFHSEGMSQDSGVDTARARNNYWIIVNCIGSGSYQKIVIYRAAKHFGPSGSFWGPRNFSYICSMHYFTKHTSVVTFT